MQRKILFISAAFFTAVICLFAVKSPCQDFEYEARGRRDPFVPLVGIERVKISGLEDAVSVDDIRLEGIMVGPGGKKKVFMNGRMLKEGDRVGVVEIINIGKGTVTLLIGGAEHKIALSKEGGTKDEL